MGSKNPESRAELKSYDKKDNIIFTEKSDLIASTLQEESSRGHN
jgi:hypothetical protein